MRQAAVAIGSPFATVGALQLLSASQVPQWSAVAAEFVTPGFWLTVLMLVISGALGGVAYELLLRGGTIELPHRVRPHDVGRTHSHAPADSLIALGVLGRALVGSAAAVTVLLVVSPSNAHATLALGVTSGAAAPALIRLMRRQLMLAADALGRMQRSPAPAAAPRSSAPVGLAASPAD
jgi:hypothetical protein